MYRCGHCRDLHITAQQARLCARHDDDCFEDVLVEVERILQRGPIPWGVKRAMRDDLDWTWPERLLWKALRETLASDAIRTQWWIPGCDFRVDFLIAPIDLVIEVDGASHEARAGADRLRSSVIRSHGYRILRVPNDVALRDPASVAALISDRIEQELEDAAPMAVSA